MSGAEPIIIPTTYEEVVKNTHVESIPPDATTPPPQRGRGFDLSEVGVIERAEKILNIPDDTTLDDQQRLFLIAYTSLGTVSDACKAVGVSHARHNKWMKESEEYRETFEAAFNTITDALEKTSLMAALHPDNSRERMFLLQARRPERYGNKVRHSGKVEHVHSLAELAKKAYQDGTLDEEGED